MVTKTSKLLWTHFTKNEEGKGFHGFTIDTCEKCGKECEGANAVGFMDSRAKLLKLGLVEIPKRLDEMGYCDILEMVTCTDCHEVS